MQAASLRNAVIAVGVAATFIAGYEGMKYIPYLDTGNVPTVCAGHTQAVDRTKIYTAMECRHLLDKDTLIAAQAVDRLVNVPLNENQKVALISFVFNVGEGAFAKSTMRRLLNKGRYTEAAAQFQRWTYDNGVQLRGLVIRRAAERALFLTPESRDV